MICLLKQLRLKHRPDVPFVEATEVKNIDANALFVKGNEAETSIVMPCL